MIEKIKQIWNSIVINTEIYKDFEKEYVKLEETALNLNNENKQLFRDYNALEKAYDEVEDEYRELKKEYDKISPETLDEYKSRFFEEMKMNPLTHSYRGDGKKRAIHKHLDNFRLNKELQLKYLNFMKEKGMLKTRYSTADDLILHLTNQVHKFIDNRWQSDKKVFNHLEYWLNPTEAFDYYVNKGNYGDCDDTGTFIYSCLITALYAFGFESEMWRLMNGLVNIIGSGGHYTLTWLKADNEENVIGWIVVESTYAQSEFSDCWKKNKLFKHNWLYQPIRLFNEEAEYSPRW